MMFLSPEGQIQLRQALEAAQRDIGEIHNHLSARKVMVLEQDWRGRLEETSMVISNALVLLQMLPDTSPQFKRWGKGLAAAMEGLPETLGHEDAPRQIGKKSG